MSVMTEQQELSLGGFFSDGTVAFQVLQPTGRLQLGPKLRDLVSSVERLQLRRGSRSGFATVTELDRDGDTSFGLAGFDGTVRKVVSHPRAAGDVESMQRLFAAVPFVG